ncbi:hypothetical protein F4810DRAFT_718310 [Camillea tinctor]|nr:hypothetical protein F4810DRAFT_718310 [Camillea tinctor]
MSLQDVTKSSTKLRELQDEFTSMKTTNASAHAAAQTSLARKNNSAMAGMADLAVLLDGEFDPAHPPDGLAPALKRAEGLWADAKDAALDCWNITSSYSIKVAQLHDSKIAAWHSEAQELKGHLQSKLDTLKGALATQRNTLEDLLEAAEGAAQALKTMDRKLYEAQHKYDEADMWTLLWPPARLYLEGLKLLIEATTNDQEGARRGVATAQAALRQAQTRAADAEALALDTARRAAAHAGVLRKGRELLAACAGLVGGVEAAQREVGALKNECVRAQEVVGRCATRAEGAGYALTKGEYGEAILRVCEVGLESISLRPAAVSICKHLAAHDDGAGSIRGIRTEQHKEGLLAYLEAQGAAVTGNLLANLPPMMWMAAAAPHLDPLPLATEDGMPLTEEHKTDIMNFLHSIALF